MTNDSRARRWYDVDLVLFCLGLAGLLFLTSQNAHTFPLMDDWRYCDFYQGQSYWQFVRSPHNEHNLWVFKALTVPFIELTRWNTRPFVLVGLVVYAAALTSLLLLIRRVTPSPIVRCAAALFLVLPGPYENLTWAWQTQFHLCFLFGVIGLWSVQRAHATPRKVALLARATGCGILSLFSVGGGVAYALGIAVALSWFGLGKVAPLRPQERRVAFGGAAALLLSAIYYLHISPHPAHHPHLTLPWKEPSLFTQSLMRGMGLGLSYPNDAEAAQRAGWIGLAVIAVGIMIGWRTARSSLIVVAGALTVACIGPAMVAVARAGFGLGATVVPRYMEISLILTLPFFWALGRIYSRHWGGWKVLAAVIALAVPANAARSLPGTVNAMQEQHASLLRATQCWRANRYSTACLGQVYPYPEYVAGCLEMIHDRWNGWGHLGGD